MRIARILLIGFVVMSIFLGCSAEKKEKMDLEAIKEDRAGLDFASTANDLFIKLDALLQQWHEAQNRDDMATMQFLGNELNRLSRAHFSELVNALSTPNSSIAAGALGFSADSNVGENLQAIPYLNEALLKGDDDTKQNAALALGHIGSDQTPMEPLCQTLNNKNNADGIRAMAAYAISQIVQKDKEEGTMQHLLPALNDSSTGVKHHVVIALSKIGDPQGIQAIADTTIRDPHPIVRYNSLSALVNFDDKKYAPQVVPLLQDEMPETREAAYNILKEWSGKDYGSDVGAWKQWAGIE